MLAAVCAGVIVLSLLINLLPQEMAAYLVRENGLVEMLTALGYIAGAGWLFLVAGRGQINDGASAGLVVVLLGLRELDFHARFTTMGVFKTRYYISPEVPGDEKLIVSLIMICILVIVARFLRRNFATFWDGLRQRDMSALSLGLAVGSGLLSKVLDSFSGPLRKLVAHVHNDPRTFLRVIEETMELAIPIFILFAIYYALKSPAES